MIYINFVVLQILMLHAKFQGNWYSGSGEEDWRFWAFLAWHQSWSCDLDQLYKLSFPLPKEAPHKIWLFGHVVSEEKMFENLRTTTDDDGWRAPDHGYNISSLCELEGSGELKIKYLSAIAWLKRQLFISNY